MLQLSTYPCGTLRTTLSQDLPVGTLTLTVDGGNLAPSRAPKLVFFVGVRGLELVQDFLNPKPSDCTGLPAQHDS